MERHPSRWPRQNAEGPIFSSTLARGKKVTLRVERGGHRDGWRSMRRRSMQSDAARYVFVAGGTRGAPLRSFHALLHRQSSGFAHNPAFTGFRSM